MAYQQVKEILESIRKCHRQLRREAEAAHSGMDDPRSKFLLRSFRRSEQEMDVALGRYEKDGEAPILETWIQYAGPDELERVLKSRTLPPHSGPDEILDWKQRFDESLLEYYRHLSREVSAPRAKNLFDSLAAMVEQQLNDQTWQAREEELAPNEDN